MLEFKSDRLCFECTNNNRQASIPVSLIENQCICPSAAWTCRKPEYFHFYFIQWYLKLWVDNCGSEASNLLIFSLHINHSLLFYQTIYLVLAFYKLNANQANPTMQTKKSSPKISGLKWGTVEVDDNTKYKDAKLFPGGSRKWDWNETGTSHVPGIQPADVEELLEHDADVVVLSKGINRRLQVQRETEEMLSEKEIDYYILQTEEAVEKYNELREKHRVGALIHSTC